MNDKDCEAMRTRLVAMAERANALRLEGDAVKDAILLATRQDLLDELGWALGYASDLLNRAAERCAPWADTPGASAAA